MTYPMYNEMPLGDQAALDALALPGHRAVPIYVECHLPSCTVTTCVSRHPARERSGFIPRSDTRYHIHVHCVPPDVSDEQVLRAVNGTVIHGAYSCDFWQLGPGKIVRP